MNARSSRRSIAALFVASLLTMLFAATASASTPGATTEAATEITPTSAVLNSTIDTGESAALAGFEYGTEKETGNGTESEFISAGHKDPVSFSQEVTGLQPNTTYYFLVGAILKGNIVYGEYLTFKTERLLGLSVAAEDAEGPASFRALEYPASVVGEPSEGNPLVLKIGASTLGCSSSVFSAGISDAASFLALDADLSGCKFEPFGSATVNSNSCHLDLTVTSEFGGKAGIGCDNGGDAIEIATSGCTVKIAAQAPVGPTFYMNQGEGNGSTVRATVGRTLEYSKSGYSCFLLTGTASLSGALSLGVE